MIIRLLTTTNGEVTHEDYPCATTKVVTSKHKVTCTLLGGYYNGRVLEVTDSNTELHRMSEDFNTVESYRLGVEP